MLVLFVVLSALNVLAPDREDKFGRPWEGDVGVVRRWTDPRLANPRDYAREQPLRILARHWFLSACHSGIRICGGFLGDSV